MINLLQLGKIRISTAVTITMITGYVLYKKEYNSALLLPALGIFFLAFGASVINQIQEYKTDRLMERTRDRPIPSGQVSLIHAWLLAILFVIVGTFFLFIQAGLVATLLGMLPMVWYNLVYTILKKKTAASIIPGALTGAIPPVVGWFIAGGYLWGEKTLVLMFFFFVWQIPHFWLIMYRYKRDYEKAGIPTLNIFRNLMIMKLTVVLWIVLTVITTLFLPLFGIVDSKITVLGIIISGIVLIIVFLFSFMKNKKNKDPSVYYTFINYFVFFVFVLLLMDHVWGF